MVTSETNLVSLPSLAKHLGISRRALFEALKREPLPRFGAGGYYVNAEDAQRWLETGRKVWGELGA